MKDNRTKEQLEASIKANLVRHGFPPELVDRAVDSWITLASNAKALAMVLEVSDGTPGSAGWWAQYCFFQGFVAGNQVQVHHN